MRNVQAVEGYTAWRDSLQSPAAAELCLRYALAFNKLDPSWLLPALAPNVTYESQSVVDVLEGADAASKYFRGQMNTLRLSRDATVRAELAALRTGEPCVALFQARDRYRTNWLDEAGANGFPTVVANWHDMLIHTQQGLIDLDSYVREIRNATVLYLMSGRSTCV